MNVLLVHHSGVLGGAEFSMLELAEALKRSGTRLTAALPKNGPLADLCERRGITVQRVPIAPLRRTVNPFVIIRFLWRLAITNLLLADVAKRGQFDVIHCDGATACLHSLAATTLTRTPMIWHERDLTRHPAVFSFILFFTTKIIAPSQAVADNLSRQLGGLPDVNVIPNGVDPDKFNLSASPTPLPSRSDLNLPNDGPLILCPAQFAPWKRHDAFIAAAKRVERQSPAARFLLAGDDTLPDRRDYVQKLKAIVRQSSIADKVAFTGFVEDMPALLRHCACVVLPSDAEPFGRVVIEGMAAGKPVIATAAGGPLEIIDDGENGLLTAPGDAEAMATAILRVLNDPDLARRLGENGARSVRDRYSLTLVADRVTAIQREAAACEPPVDTQK